MSWLVTIALLSNVKKKSRFFCVLTNCSCPTDGGKQVETLNKL